MLVTFDASVPEHSNKTITWKWWEGSFRGEDFLGEGWLSLSTERKPSFLLPYRNHFSSTKKRSVLKWTSQLQQVSNYTSCWSSLKSWSNPVLHIFHFAALCQMSSDYCMSNCQLSSQKLSIRFWIVNHDKIQINRSEFLEQINVLS